MPIIIIGIVEDVQSYEGKNGFGANITMSALLNKRRKTLTFNTKDRDLAQKFELSLQEQVTVKIELVQSNFGLRLGEIFELVPDNKIDN
ncbi:MAG: hypothetical protein E7210_18610 [Clostridium lundense]|jgi:hypothetical protein|uniref:hypothetical protein n=1 Tax=Clostridium thermopalmarium TaxID=29373 RepID=UPI00235226C8|nr:hypothetical protein [Clostridium thermopalmarium]MBE6042640.1 hypothetical protein [Clostridium thermopalmarium]MBE6079059.1 hypothetical protein [Clostridium lundense]